MTKGESWGRSLGSAITDPIPKGPKVFVIERQPHNFLVKIDGMPQAYFRLLNAAHHTRVTCEIESDQRILWIQSRAFKRTVSACSTFLARQTKSATEGHVSRLEEIFDALGEEPDGESCKAMEGLIAEGEDYVKASGDRDVRDAGLIGAAQRVEHYEIAGYGTARTLATRLGESEAADKLQTTLDEEGKADRKLTAIAESEVNPDAAASAQRAR